MSAKRDISCFISAFAEIHKKPDGCGPVLFHKKPIICIMRLFAFVPFVPYRAGTYARQTGVSKVILTRHRRAPALRLRLLAPLPASGGRLPLVRRRPRKRGCWRIKRPGALKTVSETAVLLPPGSALSGPQNAKIFSEL